MTDEQEETLIRVGGILVDIGMSIARGERRDAGTVAKDLGLLAAALLPIDDLKEWLNTADAASVDRFIELSATAKLGPRP